MKLHLMMVAWMTTCLAILTYAFPVNNEEEARLYLRKFGYLEGSDNRKAVMNALKDFQRFTGLTETGRLDSATLSAMNAPRCGVKDRIGHSDSARKKRYAHQGSKWRLPRLTYRISKYPKKIKDRSRVDREIALAFQVWSNVTKLTFVKRERGRTNIEIRFVTGDHGNCDPFDGPSKTLAHAFFPNHGGDVHFDDEERWTFDEGRGTNMFQLAVHEFGHSLGLSHTDEEQAVMFELYSYKPNFTLHSDDIRSIQSLYGSKNRTPPPDDESLGPAPDTSDAADLCQDATIDTVTRTQNGNTYVFRGEFYWKILSNGIADGYPRKITEDWVGLEGNLDASITWSNGKTFFFKDSIYWRFTNKEMDSDYPKSLSRGFEGIPNMVDAAFVWSGNGKTYFFKGDQYWRYDSNRDPPVSSRYPKPISNWNGLPTDGIDAAFQWDNRRTYFFKGDKYYKFDDATFEVESAEPPPFPRSTSVWWFQCKAEENKN